MSEIMKTIDERERQMTKTERNKGVTQAIVMPIITSEIMKIIDEREMQKTKTERNKGVTQAIVKV